MLAAGDPDLAFVFGTAMSGVSPAEQHVFSLRTRLEARDPVAVRPALTTLRAALRADRCSPRRAKPRHPRSAGDGEVPNDHEPDRYRSRAERTVLLVAEKRAALEVVHYIGVLGEEVAGRERLFTNDPLMALLTQG